MGRSGSQFKLSPSLAASAALQGPSASASPASVRINAWQREERAHAAGNGCCGGRADGARSGKAAARASPAGLHGSALALSVPSHTAEPGNGGNCRGTRASAASGNAMVDATALIPAEGAAAKQAAAPCCGTRRRRDDLDGSIAGACAEGVVAGKLGAGDRRGASRDGRPGLAEGQQTLLPALRLETSVPSPMDSCKRSKTDPGSPRLHKVGCLNA